jgi:creatinine amidohydrolase
MTSIDPDEVREEYRYELLTWPQINTAVEQRKVVILPVGSTEQHGYHLPLDTDAKLVSSVSLEAGRRSPEDILVLPTVGYGYCHHVMDFPGTINIEPTTFVRFLLDITRSVAYHGFKRIIVINGHGSNAPLVEQVGRQTNLQTDATCATLSWWQLIADYWNEEVRTSVIPGGSAHACELETSMYLHLDGERVITDRIQGAVSTSMTEIPGGDYWTKVDLTGPNGPAAIVEWTSSYSETGSFGEPEKATMRKGELAFERAVTQLIGLAKWLRARPDLERASRHAQAPTFQLPFDF